MRCWLQAFSSLVQVSDDSPDYIAFPGFEDILSQPKFLPEVIKTINSIFEDAGFHKVIFGYGHVNFRKGKGLLLHLRLPVPLEAFYDKSNTNRKLVCETVYDVIKTLKTHFNIEHKTEHSSGPFKIWLDSEFRSILKKEIGKGRAFYNPSLNIVEIILRKVLKVEPDKFLTEEIKKELFVTTMLVYMVWL